MRKRLAVATAATALALVNTAVAHHGWSGYDASQVRTLTGVNPRSRVRAPPLLRGPRDEGQDVDRRAGPALADGKSRTAADRAHGGDDRYGPRLPEPDRSQGDARRAHHDRRQGDGAS